MHFPGLFSGHFFRNVDMGIPHLPLLRTILGLRAESLILLASSASSHMYIWVVMLPVRFID